MKVLIVLCFAVGALARTTPDCPTNSHYEQCGSACPLTCDNHHDSPLACVLICNPGCHCDEGYVLDSEGNCILKEDCEQTDDTSSPTDRRNPLCELPAETGQCRAMFLKFHFNSNRGRCEEFVYGGCDGNANNFWTYEECQTTCGGPKDRCGANARHTSCGTTCPLTCDNYQNPPQYCVEMCNRGCECVEGFVQTADGQCVKPEDC